MIDVIFYQVLDLFCSGTETLYIYLLCCNILAEKPSLKVRWIPYVISYLATLSLFRFNLPLFAGHFIIILVTSAALKCVYKSKIKDLMLVWCMWILCMGIGNVLAKFLWAYFSPNTLLVTVGGSLQLTWQTWLLSQLTTGIIVLLVSQYLRRTKISYGWHYIMVFFIYNNVFYLFAINCIMQLFDNPRINPTAFFATMFASVGALLLFIETMKNIQAKEEEFRRTAQIERLENQYHYYEEKSEESRRIRQIYHDMNNLLLAASVDNGNNEILKAVNLEMEAFRQFCDTGNPILDVLLKDKIKRMQTLGVDMQLDIEFTEGAFISGRDIVAIWGNALDNAIEACEKLPIEERMITARAGKVRNMLSILIENSMAVLRDTHQATSKQDSFLHGFGINNIKEAVGRYDGTCTIESEQGRFLLKITIPLMEK